MSQLCVQSLSPLTGSSFFPKGKEHHALTKCHASGPDPVSNCQITGASLFGALSLLVPEGQGLHLTISHRPSPKSPQLRDYESKLWKEGAGFTLSTQVVTCISLCPPGQLRFHSTVQAWL